jgi:hypothetical protein
MTIFKAGLIIFLTPFVGLLLADTILDRWE